ncbi:MAG: CopG family transcriptional regulator [Thermoproteota archaeon]
MSSDILSIRISKEVKEKMGEVDVDWPSYLRAAIEEKIRESKRKRAAESMDRIRSKTRKGKFDSVKSIREDRDA